MGPKVSITVAICTLDRGEELRTTLGHLARQSCGSELRGRCEVLVVDNGITDSTRAVVAELADDFPFSLRSIREPQRGLSFARNAALRDAEGECVAFIDDDVNCSPGWLGAIAESFSDRTLDALGGPIQPVLPVESPTWLAAILNDEVGGPTARYYFGDEPEEIVQRGRVASPFGGNMAMRRALALELGGFRTDLGWGQRMIPAEETELFGRALRAGARIRYVPGAAVEHRVRPDQTTREYYCRWQQGFGRSEVIVNPPGSWAARIARLCEALFVASRSLPRSLRRELEPRNAAALRRRERAVGRLKELLGHV